jgi:hypothetical protein
MCHFCVQVVTVDDCLINTLHRSEARSLRHVRAVNVLPLLMVLSFIHKNVFICSYYINGSCLAAIN